MMKKLFLFLCIIPLLMSCGVSSLHTETAIRGVWVPAPRFTPVLHSYEEVQSFVSMLDSLNMNRIFLVSYANNQTVYKSEVLTRYSTYNCPDEGYMLAPYAKDYKSATNDPVRDLIDEAHKRGIRVFFWFEYGFMGSGRPIPADDPLLAANPSWPGIGNDGLPAHYNNHDYYFNAYHPDVQQFILDLISEAISLYPDLDGIQGDDRLPAMPRNSGYDPYTVARYQAEHNGATPPDDPNDSSWVAWRLNILNNFAKELHTRVQQIAPDMMVSFAPNPYPWCQDKLMQDWPSWCKMGVCDLLAVQCYRYNAEAYRSTVSEVLKYIHENNPQQLFAPGIILMEGGNVRMTPELLEQQLQINRELGIRGEIYFYNGALNQPELQEVWKRYYTGKATFPKK